MVTDLWPPVKEVSNARACNTCGRPTWSAVRICVPCKITLGIPLQLSNQIAAPVDLSFQVRARLTTLIILERFHVHPSTLAAALLIITFGTAIIVAVALTVAISFVIPPPLLYILSFVIVGAALALSLFATCKLFAALTEHLVNPHIQQTTTSMRLLKCAFRGYCLRAARESVCPECGAATTFPNLIGLLR